MCTMWTLYNMYSSELLYSAFAAASLLRRLPIRLKHLLRRLIQISPKLVITRSHRSEELRNQPAVIDGCSTTRVSDRTTMYFILAGDTAKDRQTIFTHVEITTKYLYALGAPCRRCGPACRNRHFHSGGHRTSAHCLGW